MGRGGHESEPKRGRERGKRERERPCSSANEGQGTWIWMCGWMDYCVVVVDEVVVVVSVGVVWMKVDLGG